MKNTSSTKKKDEINDKKMKQYFSMKDSILNIQTAIKQPKCTLAFEIIIYY